MATSDMPDSIGPYKILQTLGSGGMGTVYLGRHNETDQEVAVKVLSPTMAREEGLVERFRREVGALEKMTNRHIVQIFESGESQAVYFYAMEYVPGETLTEKLQREKRLGWEEVIEVAVQVCVALKAAHDAGIIHRDLKPGNLMFHEEGIVKLTDFGVAQVFTETKLTATGGVVGTAEYMSPEQALGRRVTRTSDLYSLGAVMYCMLTGRPPFRGKSVVEVIQQHRYGQFDSPRSIVPEIPRWLDELVCRLMEKDPEDRYPDAYVLSLRLKEIPAKVKLAQDVGTVADGVDSDVETVAAGLRAPGEATLMRDLMRAEIDRAQQPSPLGRWFNSTIGLVVMLGSTAVFAWWMWQRDHLTPEQRFESGVRMMQSADPDWRTAREVYFLPLLELDLDDWQGRVRPYLDQITDLELESRLRTRTRSARPQGDFERFVRLAREYDRLGDRSRAARILESVILLGADEPQYAAEIRVARQLLDSFQTADAGNRRPPILANEALERADEAARKGRRDVARKIWQSILVLYADDPRADEQVARARRELKNPTEPTDDAGP